MNKFGKKLSIIFVMVFAIMLGCFSNSVFAADSTLQPIHKYTFDNDNGNTVIDTGSMAGTSGEFNGTANGTQIKNESGQTFRSFNGTSDYINISKAILPIGKKSIKFKVRNINNTSAGYVINSEPAGGGASHGFYIHMTANGVWFRLSEGNLNSLAVSYKFNFNDNNWHTVLCTWDGTVNKNGAKLYIDDLSTPKQTATATNNLETYPEQCTRIGRYSLLGGYENYLKGDLSDIEIYNYVVEYGDKATAISLDKMSLGLAVGDTHDLVATIDGTNLSTHISTGV